MKKARAFWKTKLGFYLAAVGTAFGLGNLWRFPYIVSENGGGAFVLVYVLMAMLVGLPLLIGELILGKYTRQSVIGAIFKITQSKEDASEKTSFLTTGSFPRWVSRIAVLVSLGVVSYYAVVSGWVLHFFVQFLLSILSSENVETVQFVQVLMENGWLQILLGSVHLLIAIIVVVKGVHDGLEKWISYVMPIFSVLLLVLVYQSLSLPTSRTALQFLFYPDFSQLTSASLIHALGHVFFTLSIGFGTMVTFGSYMRESDHIPSAGFRVMIVDTSISLLAGLLVFPILLSANARVSDPTLLFEVLPSFIVTMPGGKVFGAAFFLCLYLAALGACIGLLEGIVSNWVDRDRMKRGPAAWITGGCALLFAIVPALSSSVLRNLRFGERSLLETFDSILINWILPLVVLGIGFIVSRRLPLSVKRQFFVQNKELATVKLFDDWVFSIRWVIPLIIVLALGLQIVGLF